MAHIQLLMAHASLKAAIIMVPHPCYPDPVNLLCWHLHLGDDWTLNAFQLSNTGHGGPIESEHLLLVILPPDVQ